MTPKFTLITTHLQTCHGSPSSMSSSSAPEETRLSSLQIQKTRTFSQDPQETQGKDLPNSVQKDFPDTFSDTVWLPVCILRSGLGKKAQGEGAALLSHKGPSSTAEASSSCKPGSPRSPSLREGTDGSFPAFAISLSSFPFCFLCFDC